MYTFKDMYYELSLPLGSFFGFKQNIKKTEELKIIDKSWSRNEAS